MTIRRATVSAFGSCASGLDTVGAAVTNPGYGFAYADEKAMSGTGGGCGSGLHDEVAVNLVARLGRHEPHDDEITPASAVDAVALAPHGGRGAERPEVVAIGCDEAVGRHGGTRHATRNRGRSS